MLPSVPIMMPSSRLLVDIASLEAAPYSILSNAHKSHADWSKTSLCVGVGWVIQ